MYRFYSYLSPEEYMRVRLGDEGQRLDWFSYDEAIKLNLAPHSAVYFREQEARIREFVKGCM